MKHYLPLLWLTLLLGMGGKQLAIAQDSTILVQNNRTLQQERDSLISVAKHYQTINEKYYELAKERLQLTILLWSIIGASSIVIIIGIIWAGYQFFKYKIPEIAREETVKLLKLDFESFEGIVRLYGVHHDYLKNKIIWVVEPHNVSNRNESITYLLKKLEFEKVKHYTELSNALHDLPDMILLNNEKYAFCSEVEKDKMNGSENPEYPSKVGNAIKFREENATKAVLFWYDTHGIKFPTRIENSNYANSRYTLYNNIIESFRVQDITL